MAYIITKNCFNCAGCEPICPIGAISEGETIFVIDAEQCTECLGDSDVQLCADVCSVAACVPDADHPETEQELLAKRARTQIKRP
ncbi:MAG: ferredoxin [Chloroflexi bacterium]|nr:ferredoxin [Chloroflexota bacterium]